MREKKSDALTTITKAARAAGGDAVGALVGAALAGLLLALGGCGGHGSKDDPCSATFTPCGGDIIGTWILDTRCNIVRVAPLPCPLILDDVSVGDTGTYTFNADNTYASSFTTNFTTTFTYPACSVTHATSCSQLDTHNSQGVYWFPENRTAVGWG